MGIRSRIVVGAKGNTVDKQKKVPTEELEKLDMRLKDVAACREWRERESLSVAKLAVIHSFSLLYTERTREDVGMPS